ncbi:hypothetical protein PybrP1_010789 [[Pythium] brassicae (nom. inval.)]|nr:hypothetical protein PybrP1_010789 [[Pythium] brassicae (nom. inval.)]
MRLATALRSQRLAPRGLYMRFSSTTSVTSVTPGDSLAVINTSHSWGTDLIPEDVVRELNKHIVGQEDAKKAVAIALRNRWRRRQLKDDVLRAEISPMNILMSGPTGSGKTEIARRLAKMTDSPFLKVEATKYTEVGIYGANTESMIKDLVDVAVDMERDRAAKQHAAAARDRAIDRLVELLSTPTTLSDAARATLRAQVAAGEADHRYVHVTLKPVSKKSSKARSVEGMEMPPEFENMMKHLDKLMSSRFSSGAASDANKSQRLTVKEALPRLAAEEADDIIDEDEVVKSAIEKVQNNGILFLDEVDKLANAGDGARGTFRKGEGVQKELLALTEGCAVSTRYGLVYTDHILFIASGAFHSCKPSDLMPELQGRLPIRVALAPLGAPEFARILRETEFNLLLQTRALMATEGVDLSFTDEAVDEIARISAQVNSQTDDIGARRLATIVSKITEDVSFHAPKMGGVAFEVDAAYVRQRLANVLEKTDLTKYIL